MITNLHVNARTSEVNGIANLIYQLYLKSSLTFDIQLAGIMDRIKQECNRLTDLNKRIKTYSNLKEKDQLRGEAINALDKLLIGNLHIPDPEIQEAAQKVIDIFQNYGLSIRYKSYAVESALIHSLLLDLSIESLAPFIAKIAGCKALIEALAQQQKAFEEAELNFKKSKTLQPEPASSIRLILILLINQQLMRYLEALRTLQHRNYDHFTNALMEIIREQNRIVKKTFKKESSARTEKSTSLISNNLFI